MRKLTLSKTSPEHPDKRKSSACSSGDVRGYEKRKPQVSNDSHTIHKMRALITS
jgi:hypothetical protein